MREVDDLPLRKEGRCDAGAGCEAAGTLISPSRTVRGLAHMKKGRLMTGPDACSGFPRIPTNRGSSMGPSPGTPARESRSRSSSRPATVRDAFGAIHQDWQNWVKDLASLWQPAGLAQIVPNQPHPLDASWARCHDMDANQRVTYRDWAGTMSTVPPFLPPPGASTQILTAGSTRALPAPLTPILGRDE